ncbi:peptide ABC transporter substrate-binding protein [Brevibacillus sp. SYSU BS000544]|uniref:peptide ABC transporter substrate-binding protein n=1 Tax=Brevibacillus sp. SYSU BS000544 TaxID=3416443 RepID=UPI003CE5A2ED
MKKNIFVLLTSLLVTGAALAGCGSPTNTTQTQTPNNQTPATQTPATNAGSKTLKLNLHSEPPTADPGLAEDTTSGAIVRATFDGLTRTGDDGKPHESAAEKVDVSADLKTYTFTLREGKWSNGDPVTAHDFEYAWKRALDPKTASNYAYQLYFIKDGEKFNKGQGKSIDDVGVKALDDKTLQVQLENPTPFFLELTAFYTYYPVNQKVVTGNANWAAEAKTHVGNGPFKMVEWEHKSKLILEKNEHYWDKDAVKLDRIEFSMVEDENTELAMYDNGEIDWAGSPLSSLPTDAMQALKASGKMTTVPISGTYMYKFNTEKPPFNNVKIRKAFVYALNRQAIIDNVTQANQQPALGFIPDSNSVGNSPFFQDNDVEKAKQYLAEGMKELGITSLPPISLSFNTSEAHKKIAESVQDQWKKALGVDVKLENKEWKVYIEDMHQGNFQIGRMGWLADYNDPLTFLDLFKDKDGGNNDTRWENQKYKDALNKSATEADPEKRKKLLAEAEQVLMEDMPILPIYYYTQSWVKKDSVKGVIVDTQGNVDYKWASME